MSTCQPRVLVKKEHFYIAQCKKCKRIGLTFRNILAGFNPDEFYSFHKSLANLNFKDHCMFFPDGLEHIIIHSCHTDIQFTFTEKEFYQLIEGLNEAILLLEVDMILR